MQELKRLLEFVVRELAAVDARVELGGSEPDDPRIVAVQVQPNVRVVAILATPPEDPAAARARLETLVDGFIATIEHAIDEAVDATGGARRRADPHELAEALAILRARSDATAVLVVDDTSPEIWGADPPLPWSTVDAALAAARGAPLDPTGTAARALVRVRKDPDPSEHAPAAGQPAVFAPRVLGIYRVVLAFAGRPSPLRVQGAIRRARPVLERILRDLPPRQPPPSEARVVPLPTRR